MRLLRTIAHVSVSRSHRINRDDKLILSSFFFCYFLGIYVNTIMCLLAENRKTITKIEKMHFDSLFIVVGVVFVIRLGRQEVYNVIISSILIVIV